MKKFSFLIILLALLIGGFAAWWINGIMPPTPSDKTPKMFVISKGEGVRQIANNLAAEGLIKDPVIFFLFVKQQGLEGKIQAGEFRLFPSMSLINVTKALQVGTFDRYMTIPEGKRAEEIAEILQTNLSTYEDSWLPRLRFEEGYLFPDTYSFAKDVDIETVIATMKANFEKKYLSIPTSTTLSKEQIVVIASMVEREAKLDEDRPLVASVMLNRLRIGMPLQIDATVQYALGYNNFEKTWWKKNVTLEDLRINSPYNTYINTGLPPKPIANPGSEALKAVLEAPDTGYIYYISDPKTGKNVYAKTLTEHNANIKKYGL